MARIAVIGDEMTALGMRLAGVKNSLAAGKEDVQETYDRLKEGSDIIVVTHSLFGSLKHLDEGKITVSIPDMQGGGEGVLGKLVKRVVGFEVKA
jgi:vacuolar-type H+-ATPase subunit F/Vma7